MKERQAWEQFLATGRVEDYLACVGKPLTGEKRMDEPDQERQQERSIRNEEVKCRSL